MDNNRDFDLPASSLTLLPLLCSLAISSFSSSKVTADTPRFILDGWSKQSVGEGYGEGFSLTRVHDVILVIN